MTDLDKYTEGANYWDLNPQLTFKAEFKALRETDTSRGKWETSQIMWAIAFIYSYKSDYFDYSFEDKIDVVEKDFLNKPGFFSRHGASLEPVIEAYMKLQYDAPRRLLAEQQKLLDKRAKFLDSVEYEMPYLNEKGKVEPGTAKTIDDMAKNTKTIYDHYLKIRQEVLKEEAKMTGKGKAELGLLEEGKI